MHFIDKVFPRWEKKNFFTLLGGIVLAVAILLAPALLKFVFSKIPYSAGSSKPSWAYLIFAHLLFLVQVFFFFKHPACRGLNRHARIAAGFLLLYLLGCLASPLLTGCYSKRTFQEILKLVSAASLFFLVQYCSYKGSCRGVLRAVAFLGCLIATGEALVGLIQYIFQGDIGLQWAGEKHLQAGGSFASVKLMGGVRWFGDSGTGALWVLRSYGTFDHPNHLGGVLVAGSLLTCHLLCHAQSKKFLLTMALALQALALVTTFSRSAWLGIVLGVFVLLACRIARQSGGVLSRCRGLWRGERTLAAALCISACMALFVFHEQILQRCSFRERYKEGTNAPGENLPKASLQYLKDIDIGERVQFLEIAQAMVLKHPWQGVGFQEYVRQMPHFATSGSNPLKPQEVQRLAVHNIYMLTAAEIGLPFAASFVLFILLTALQGMRNERQDALLAIWVAFALIGFMDNYLLTWQAGRVLFFAIASILLSYSTLLRGGLFRSS